MANNISISSPPIALHSGGGQLAEQLPCGTATALPVVPLLSAAPKLATSSMVKRNRQDLPLTPPSSNTSPRQQDVQRPAKRLGPSTPDMVERRPAGQLANRVTFQYPEVPLPMSTLLGRPIALEFKPGEPVAAPDEAQSTKESKSHGLQAADLFNRGIDGLFISTRQQSSDPQTGEVIHTMTGMSPERHRKSGEPDTMTQITINQGKIQSVSVADLTKPAQQAAMVSIHFDATSNNGPTRSTAGQSLDEMRRAARMAEGSTPAGLDEELQKMVSDMTYKLTP